MSIETSASHQAVGFIIKRYNGISNMAVCRQRKFSIGSMTNNRCPIMCRCAKVPIAVDFSIAIDKP